MLDDNPIVDWADDVFFGHREISAEKYRATLDYFFRSMKGMSQSDRIFYFHENYYSEDGIAWVILNNIKYFTLVQYSGMRYEKRYYGKQTCNF